MRNNQIYPYLLIWFLINAIQAFFTELGHDEAYYWMFSQNLDWGYYDHPPMVAFMIFVGDTLLHHEFGLRLFTIILSTSSMFFIWKFITELESEKQHNAFLYTILYGSMVLLNAYGFITVPDAPLLFFAALFLWMFRRYVFEKSNFWTLFLLSVATVGMLYSKYHAVLIVGFGILANLKLLQRKSFYVVFLLSVVLYFPHIFWQVENDYPSVMYHLFNRDRHLYTGETTLVYVLNQLAVLSPLLILQLFWFLWKKPLGIKFEGTLKVWLFGFWIFFFVSSLKGHVEPHWTGFLSYPMVVFLYFYVLRYPNLYKQISIASYMTIGLLIGARLFLMLPNTMIRTEFHGKKKIMSEISKIAGTTPVVFRNSYVLPALYSYYTGNKAHGQNSIYYRRSQYSIWPIIEELEGKPVVLFGGVNPMDITPKEVPFEKDKGEWEYSFLDRYVNFEKLHVSTEVVDKKLKRGASLKASVTLKNLSSNAVDLATLDTTLYDMELVFITTYNGEVEDRTVVKNYDFLKDVQLTPGATFTFDIELPFPLQEQDKYQCMVCLKLSPYLIYYSSERWIDIELED